jgi:hypothetical protein
LNQRKRIITCQTLNSRHRFRIDIHFFVSKLNAIVLVKLFETLAFKQYNIAVILINHSRYRGLIGITWFSSLSGQRNVCERYVIILIDSWNIYDWSREIHMNEWVMFYPNNLISLNFNHLFHILAISCLQVSL